MNASRRLRTNGDLASWQLEAKRRGNLRHNGVTKVKTLKQIGNSYGVIIEKPVLEILHITPETPLEITTDGRSLHIRPVRQRKKPTLSESLEAVNRRYASTLKKLAK